MALMRQAYLVVAALLPLCMHALCIKIHFWLFFRYKETDFYVIEPKAFIA